MAESLPRLQSLYDRHRYLDLYALTAAYWDRATDVGALPVDALVLGGRLASRLGGERLSRWLLREAYRRDPSDPGVRYFTRRLNPGRMSPLDELRDFIAHPDIGGDDPSLRAAWYASFAYTWATLRDFERAHDCLRIAHSLCPEDGWVLHLESGVYALADRWADALRSAERACEIDPGAPFVAYSLGLALNRLGRVEESAARLFAHAESGQSYETVVVACWHQCALAETLEGERRREVLDGARRLAGRLPDLMPLADRETLKTVARTNLDIAGVADDRAGIERWVADVHSPFHRQLLANLARNTAGDRVRLPFRRTIQKYDTCVPASLAAALSAGGMHISADDMAAEITHGGTPEWAAADWLRARGYHVRVFSATPDLAIRLIRNGIALTVILDAEESGHAVAVVGFDERAGILLVHDPNSFRTSEYLFAALDPLTSPIGIRGMAVVRAEQAPALDALLPPESDVMAAAMEHSKQMTLHGPSAAREVVAGVLERFPTHPGARYLRAAQALEDGRIGQALGELKELLGQFPQSPLVRVRFMLACQALGNSALVRQALKDIVEAGLLPGVEAQQDWIYPPDRYVYEYADLLKLSSDTRPRAERLLLGLIGRQPTSAGAWHILGDLLWQKRDHPGALLSYGIGAGLAESDEHYARAYAEALVDDGREGEAFRWLEARARGFRNAAHAASPWISWICVLEDRGYPERALAVCQEALGRQGASAELLSFAVPFFARMGDWAKAEAELERLRGAGRPYAFFEASTHFHRMRGDLEAAARNATAWIAELPRSLDARRGLLDIVAARDGAAAAVGLSRRWLDENGNHEDFEVAHCEQLDRASAPRGKKFSVLLRRLKRNPEDAWAWHELAFAGLNYYDLADERERARLEPRLARYLAECDRTSAGTVVTLRAHSLWSEVHGDWPAAVARSVEAIALAPESFYSYRRVWECSSRLKADEHEDLWRRIEPMFLSAPGRLSIARDVAGLLAERWGIAAVEKSVDAWRAARPDDPDILEAAADLLIEHGHGRADADRAIGLLEPAVQRYPYHPGLRFSLAQAYRRAGRDPDAETVLAEIDRRHPDRAIAKIQLAWIRSSRGDERGASELLDRATAVEPQNADPLDARVGILIEHARFDEAIREVETGLRRLPLDARWRNRAVTLLVQCGAADKAIQAARGGVEADPGNAYLWLVLGRTLGDMRQYADMGEIERCLRKSLALNGILFEAADLLAMLMTEQRRYDDAARIMTDIESRLTDPSPARGRLAWIRRQRGQKSEAIADMADVVEAAPWYGWGWGVLMEWLEEDQAWDQTRRLLHVIAPPLSANTGFRRHRLLLLERAQADVKELDDEWSRLLNDYPEDVSLHLTRYDILSAAKRFEEAAAVLQAIIHVGANDPFLLARRCEALARGDQRDAACEIAERVCFLPVEESTWPAQKVWAVARLEGFAGDLSLRFTRRLAAGDRPTVQAVSRLADYAMRDVGKRRPQRRSSIWFPRGGASELMRLVDQLTRAPWDGSEHRAVVYSLLCDYGYSRLVPKISAKIDPAAVTAVDEWAQIGRALVDSNLYAAARRFFKAWRERNGVAMWMVANYVLSLSAFRRGQVRERYSSARDALAGLPHDHCAKYLAHVQADACARLGDRELFLETWASQARYFDGRLEDGQFFRSREGYLLAGLPKLANELEGRRGWRARLAFGKFRLRSLFAWAAGPKIKGLTGTDITPMLSILVIALYILARTCATIGPEATRSLEDRRPSVAQELPSSGTAAPFSLAPRNPALVARVTHWSSEDGSYGATGEVINRGTKSFHFIRVRVEFCDATGRVVGSLSTQAVRDPALFPGRAVLFSVRGIGKMDFATARASVTSWVEVQ